MKNLNGKGASGVRAAVPFQDGDDDGIGWGVVEWSRGDCRDGTGELAPKSPTNRGGWQKPDGPRETRARLMAAVAFR